MGQLGKLPALGAGDLGSNPSSPIFYKMPAKLKKTKSAGKFGARYGKRVRQRLIKVEEKQRLKQKCPFCGGIAKRSSKGIWLCSRKKCNKKFASDTYYLE